MRFTSRAISIFLLVFLLIVVAKCAFDALRFGHLVLSDLGYVTLASAISALILTRFYCTKRRP